jgi:hypothetical protein
MNQLWSRGRANKAYPNGIGLQVLYLGKDYLKQQLRYGCTFADFERTK